MEADEFILGILEHRAQFEKPYDPVKAHEYYMRTRELKARNRAKMKQPGGDSAKKGASNKGNAEANKAKSEAKKGELARVSEANKKASQALQEGAKAKREAISQKLQALQVLITQKVSEQQASLKAEYEKKLTAISEKAQEQIEALPPIPKGANSKTLARLVAKRRGEIAEIQGTAKIERDAVNKETTSRSNKITADATFYKLTAAAGATSEQTTLTESIKSSVDKAQANYQVARTVVLAKYKSESEVTSKKR